MFVLAFASLYVATAYSVQMHALAWACVGVAVLWTVLLPEPRRAFDAVLRLRLPAQQGPQAAFAEMLKRHCDRFVLVNLRDVGGDCLEHSYQLRFPQLMFRVGGATLLRDVKALPGVTGATLVR